MVSLFADTGQMQTSWPFGTIPATGVLKLDWRLAAPPAGMSAGFFYLRAKQFWAGSVALKVCCLLHKTFLL